MTAWHYRPRLQPTGSRVSDLEVVHGRQETRLPRVPDGAGDFTGALGAEPGAGPREDHSSLVHEPEADAAET